MNNKAVTLTETLIAISIALTIILPISMMFSNSSRTLEKTSNLSFAGGLARYIIQGMMTMEKDEIVQIPPPGISCCDESDDNTYFKKLFNFYNVESDLDSGVTTVGIKNCVTKLYNRFARYNYRYSISVAQISGIKSVSVLITWKEFGVDKVFESHAYIVAR